MEIENYKSKARNSKRRNQDNKLDVKTVWIVDNTLCSDQTSYMH